MRCSLTGTMHIPMIIELLVNIILTHYWMPHFTNSTSYLHLNKRMVTLLKGGRHKINYGCIHTYLQVLSLL